MTNSPMNVKAFLFDLNGTMVNDIYYHIDAWHKIQNHLGANLSYDRVKVNATVRAANYLTGSSRIVFLKPKKM